MTAPTQSSTHDKESIVVVPLPDMSIAELRSRLIEAPGSMEMYAAVDILCESFAGILLGHEDVQKAFNQDDGHIYINWDHIERVAGNWDTGFRTAGVPVGAAIALRVARSLATGQLTPSTARVLAGSLAVVGRRQRPTRQQ